MFERYNIQYKLKHAEGSHEKVEKSGKCICANVK